MNAAGAGVSFFGSLALGFGIGSLSGNMEVGGAVGLGTGLLILAFYREKDG